MKIFTTFILLVASYCVSAQCSAPTGLTTSDITATGSIGRWQAVSGAISYDIELKTASSPDWLPYFTGATGLQCYFMDLSPTTVYDWRIKANCSSGSSSYTQSQFTTGAIGSCLPPGGLSATGMTSISVNLSWASVSGAYGYTVQYKPVVSSTWVTANNTDLTSVTIYSLSAGTTYDWRVRANCGLNEGSLFSNSQFTTTGSATTCPGPYDVSSNGATMGAATIPLNTDVKGTVSPKYDIDYYKFSITSAGTLTVTLTTLPANYDLAVMNSSGAQIGVSKNKGSKSESISLSVAVGSYYARVFPVGTANNATSCYTLKVQTGTATKAITMGTPSAETVNPEFAVKLFPNPANDLLNIWTEGAASKVQIKLYNITGKLVMQQQSSNLLTPVNISSLPAGIYLVNVNNGGEVKSVKFMKQ
jgi:Secretion system C-terminal sorting domain/Fibronectin type III domain/Bacterial pre-peptidase C-terminal domain